jgi:hypothetical protein
MADPRFIEAWGYVGITVGSTNVIAGDAIYFDGTDWELADADDNTKFAELFAAESYDTGARGVGVDLPYAVASAAVTADGDWTGLSMTADSDGAGGTGVFPNSTVGLVVAHLWHYNEDALASGNFTLDVSAGKDSDTGTTTTDGVSTTALSEATNDDIGKEIVTTGFDATGIVEAGNHFGVQVDKQSETGADDYRFHGIEVVVLVV